MKKHITPLFAIPLIFATVALGSEPGRFERTLNVTGPVTLNVSSGPGGVTVSVGPSHSVTVRAVIRAAFGRADLGLAEANIQTLEQNPPIEQSGNTIRIGYVKNESLLEGVSVTYDIQTPRDTQVQASADAGALHIMSVQGPVETHNDAGMSDVVDVAGALQMTTRSGGIMVRNAGSTALLHNESGGVQLDGAKGAVMVDTRSGRIELANVSGQVSATTQSASIRLHDISGDAVATNHSGSIENLASSGATRASTESGSIRISQVSSAAVHAVSGSGAIRIELAPGKGYNLSLHSEKGKISAHGIAIPGKDQRNLTISVSGGGSLIEVQTRSSKIEID